ncbi:hypothetical protein SAMN05421788_102270 [Filimonas lacunae]|uniref:YD repeat-containing protein n=1 Tax=Filimonas lacunae TaxID=477680 RepID=A0A173MHX3_9BACT|nr:hypothetical protein [Filimonas lacunae]BAV07099.1 hypothetical protein FLA_3119 [Filimonas lacunae]SIS95000.1 hypothetical protein SAMN05421788_102270 [Filimonas lacunae]
MLYSFYRNCAIALGLLVFATSCNKNNDNAAPQVADSVYMPTVIYDGDAPLDSFVYNNDNTVATAYNGRTYQNHMNFEYNSEGKCKRVFYYLGNESQLAQVDTLVYAADGSIAFSSYYPSQGRPIEYAVKVKFNSNGAVVSLAQDTVKRDGGYKQTLTANFTFANNNLTQYSTNYYLEDGGAVESNYTSSFAFEYNQRANSWLEFYHKNPFIQVLLGYYQIETFLFTASANELAKFSPTYSGSETKSYPVNNTYDNATGTLVKQQIGDDTNEYATFSFKYKKVAKK